MNFKENLLPKLRPVFEGAVKGAEPGVQYLLERNGFVPVEEDKQAALTARIDTLRSTWALNGLDYLIKFDESAVSQQTGIRDPRVDQLAEGILTNHWQEMPSDRLQSVLKRMVGVPQRNKLLMETLSNIYGYGAPNEQATESHRRLSMMLDIAEGRIKQPTGNKRGIIFAQTAYILGEEIDGKKETHYPHGLDQAAKIAIQLGSGALPYMGAAVVYAELMSTGQFAEIEFADFRDQKAIEDITSRSNEYDLALVAGATTFDRFVIDDLNLRLSQSGLTVINGGVAPTIDEEPERYMANGASIFVGEFEGAAEQLMEAINTDSTPRVFVRNGSRSQIARVSKRGAPYTALEDLPDKADVAFAYSDEREMGGNLAHRLEAMEKMRITYDFGGKIYEGNPFFKFHQTEVAKGCPEACSFCATVPFMGREMRARSLETIEREWAAVESPIVAIVDQNFHANGRDYVTNVLQIAEKLGKRLAFEGEALFFTEGKNQRHFFDGTPADEERRRLVKNTVVAIQVGLEQPVKVRGTIPGGKDPELFPEALKRLNDMGVIVFGTSIVGMPKELWAPGTDTDLPIVPYENMSPEEWRKMVETWVDWLTNKVPVPGSIPFAFTVVPGTQAKDILSKKGMLISDKPAELIRRKELPDDLSPSVDPNVIRDPNKGLIKSREAVEDIRRELYTLPNIKKRIDAANLSLKRKLFMYGVGIFSDRTLRDRMQ